MNDDCRQVRALTTPPRLDPGPGHGGLYCFGEFGDVLCIRPAGDAHSYHVPYRPGPGERP
ncbi:hypothetical protein [Streptomyces sp. NPDC012616]|uniref:hypothetical protein n=1 Tax=Streptomyces sp. NPDC012616 TaxID=3364840 RepID=UPI0036E52833